VIEVFILNNKSDNYYLEYLISILSIFYLLYFIFFYDYGFLNIQFLNYKLIFNSDNLLYKDLIYTILSCSLIVIIYYIYRFSIQSNSVYRNDKEAFIIGIGGDSGSGKSTLLDDIKQIFGNKLTNIEGDGDHKWERGDLNWENFTHLDPKANFIYKQADDILNLKNYKRIIRNEYNHDNGKFIKNLYYKPNEIITLSGLHTFYLPKLRKLLNLRVFLNTDNKLRKYWKIKRDTIERGYQIEAVIESFNKRELDSIKYIQPQMKYSNFIINYFVDDNFEEDKINTIPIIKLKLEIDSNINTEILCTFLLQNNISYTWDYSENLETQYFHFNQEPFLDYKSLSNDLILNLDELISQEIKWQEGYRVIIQLFILLIVRDYKIL
jgi:uridine kinase